MPRSSNAVSARLIFTSLTLMMCFVMCVFGLFIGCSLTKCFVVSMR